MKLSQHVSRDAFLVEPDTLGQREIDNALRASLTDHQA